MSKREFQNKIAYNKMARQKMRLENIILTALLCIVAFTITFFMSGCDGVNDTAIEASEVVVWL